MTQDYQTETPTNRKRWGVNCLTTVALLALMSCGTSNTKGGYGSRLNVGEQFINNGKYEEGYQILEEVAQTNPDSPLVAKSLGDTYFRLGAYSKALQHYENAFQRGEEFEGLIGKGRVALAQNRGQDALVLYGEALKIEPQSPDAWNGVGVAYDILGDHTQARATYSKVLSLAPNHVAASNNLGVSLALGGNSAQAVSLLSDLSRSFLDSSKIRQNLAFAYSMNGQEADSLKVSRIDLSEDESRINLSVFKRFRSRG